MALEQPKSGEPNQSTKQCWSCESTTPYDIGFCPVCWSLVTNGFDGEAYNLSFRCTPAIGGAIRLALARHIAYLRRPQTRTAKPVITSRVRRTLPDISLSLEDLEL